MEQNKLYDYCAYCKNIFVTNVIVKCMYENECVIDEETGICKNYESEE